MKSNEELPVTRPLARAPSHPGDLMTEILEETLKVPVAQAAKRMQVSRQSLYAVLCGDSAVTPDMALRFGKFAGGAPELYVAMQGQRDLWLAARRLADQLAAIEPVRG